MAPTTRSPSRTRRRTSACSNSRDLGKVAHHRGQASHQHRRRSGRHRRGGCAARVCAASRPNRSRPSVAAVEGGTECQQLADPLGTLGDEDIHRFRIGEAVAGGEGVLRVLCRGIAGPDRDGDAALGPGGRAVGERALGKEQRLAAFGRQAPCGPESGDSGAYDEGNRLGHRLEYRRPGAAHLRQPAASPAGGDAAAPTAR